MLKRILVSGGKNFIRGGAVSFATVLIMTVTLAIMSLLMLLSALLTFTLASIQDKVDINVYFTIDAQEADIFALRDQLEVLPEVERVEYTSRDQALADFRERHKDDQLALQALDELQDNPLGATLAIKAKNPEQYESIVNFLQSGEALGSASAGNGYIDRINYFQNKTTIDRLTGAMRATERVGLGIVILFALASIIIAYATIRLAIYTAKDEIGVMRLVGASNMYIRGPFIVTGVLSGLIAGVLMLVLLYPATLFLGEKGAQWLGGFNLFTHYITHIPLFFGSLVGGGFLIGAISSYFAVRKYLRS